MGKSAPFPSYRNLAKCSGKGRLWLYSINVGAFVGVHRNLTKPFSGRGVALVQVRGVLQYPRP